MEVDILEKKRETSFSQLFFWPVVDLFAFQKKHSRMNIFCSRALLEVVSEILLRGLAATTPHSEIYQSSPRDPPPRARKKKPSSMLLQKCRESKKMQQPQQVHKPKTTRPINLLPHQQKIQDNINTIQYPFYLYWAMGSGKTIAGCLFFQLLRRGEKGLVLCDKTIVTQWRDTVDNILVRNNSDYAHGIDIQVHHYERLDTENGPRIPHYKVVVVDEAHRFRNAWIRQSERMLSWIQRIQQCERIIYLSGTPIVHNADEEYVAFQHMMGKNFKGRVSYFDPCTDPKTRHKYASIETTVIYCPMSWAQCLKYLLSRRQRFEICLPDEDVVRVRLTSSRNSYNTLLRSISNNPYPDTPTLSRKFAHIIERMVEIHEQGLKQLVYSSRRDTGILGLVKIWDDRLSTSQKAMLFIIQGNMSEVDRGMSIRKFNRCSDGILFITDAGARGVDLENVDAVHIVEPSENIQEERQVINRAIRYNGHTMRNATVQVYHYLTTFPRTGDVAPPWKNEAYKSGLFDKTEMKGLTRKLQHALRQIITDEEEDETVDEKVFKRRTEREPHIQLILDIIAAADFPLNS